MAGSASHDAACVQPAARPPSGPGRGGGSSPADHDPWAGVRRVESLARAAEVVPCTRGRPLHRTTWRRKDDLAGCPSGVHTKVVADRGGVVGRSAVSYTHLR